MFFMSLPICLSGRTFPYHMHTHTHSKKIKHFGLRERGGFSSSIPLAQPNERETVKSFTLSLKGTDCEFWSLTLVAVSEVLKLFLLGEIAESAGIWN